LSNKFVFIPAWFWYVRNYLIHDSYPLIKGLSSMGDFQMVVFSD
jgi:hypothetical protein